MSVPDRAGRLCPPSVGERTRSMGPEADRRTQEHLGGGETYFLELAEPLPG